MESEHVQGFGLYLERERTRQGLTLEDLSQRTKITLRMLNALEDEDWEILPADVYVRGFIKSYAVAVGVDPDEPLKRFDALRKQRPDASHRVPSAVTGEVAPVAAAEDDDQRLVTPESAVAAWLAAARRKGSLGVAPPERNGPARERKKTSGVGRGPRKVSLAVILILVIVALTLVVSYMVNRQGSTESQSKKPAANETVNFDLTG